MLLEHNKKYVKKIRALARRQRALNAKRAEASSDSIMLKHEGDLISAAIMRISDEFAAELLDAGVERDGIAVSATLYVWEDLDAENEKYINEGQKDD